MTRFPTESRDVKGLSGEEWPQELPKVGPYCATPGCTRPADHAHHLFSRGMMGGAYNWVRLPDGNVTGNLVGLCFQHHEQVTNNEVTISWTDGEGFTWLDPTRPRQKLTTQPPFIETQGDPPAHVYEQDNGHVHQDERQICPTCERPMPKPKLESDPEAPKERKTWAVSVPQEKWEDGADVLDELLEGIRDELDKAGLSYSEGKKVKYHILATALALFLQNADQVLSDS